MPKTLEEKDWDTLLKRIAEKKCTPFVGAGACFGTLPLARDVARRWAEQHRYPLTDASDLARVAQYLTIEEDDDLFPKEDFGRQCRDVRPPDFSARDEPHGLLADLDLPIYLTTNYDDFLVRALQSRRREPKRELCRWHHYIDMVAPPVLVPGYTPTPQSPLVYHLHGHFDVPQSMVLTEDDYLDFQVKLASDKDLLPAPVRAALAGTSLLFIGYSLADWNVRVVFRGLVRSLGASLGMKSVAVQLSPDSLADSSESGRERAQAFLESYFAKIQKMAVRVYWGDVKAFTQELRERWEASRG